MQALKDVIKGKSFASLVGNGISAIIGVLTFAFLARSLGRSDFGIWILFLAVYGIFDTLRIGLLLNAIVRNVASAVDIDKEKVIIGSGAILGIFISLLFCLLLWLVYLGLEIFEVFPEQLHLIKWYALIAIVSFPSNFSTWVLNSKLKIKSMSAVRIVTQLLFILISIYWFQFEKSIEIVFISYFMAQLLSSLMCIVVGWSGFQYLFRYSKNEFFTILNFGKYSMGTLMGSNLLKSSDTFLIGTMLSPLGVAAYNVPLRFIEIVEMPLRAFAIAAMPYYAKLFAEKDIDKLKSEFSKRTGFITFLLLPVSVCAAIFAKPIVVLLGGEAYADTAILLRLFAVYTALSPIDKFSGVLLDIINKPHMNFIKVLLMLAVNIIGDIFCLKVFGNLESIAIVSTMTFITGVLFAYYYLYKYLNLQITSVFAGGYSEFKYRFNQFSYGRNA